QIEVARKQAELFHGELGAREALRKIRSRQPVLGEFFDIGLAYKALFAGPPPCEPCILAGKLEHLIDRLEQLLGVKVGHFDLGGLVLAKLARRVRQALGFRRRCTCWRCWLLANYPAGNEE